MSPGTPCLHYKHNLWLLWSIVEPVFWEPHVIATIYQYTADGHSVLQVRLQLS
jgi:hypothetical protein